jgi:hypothetical protein
MKRNIIVERLINEGMSEKTLVKLNDKQLSELAERMLGEDLTTTAAAMQKSPQIQQIAKTPGQNIKLVGEEDMTEDLKGNQKKIDKNHNGKIDAQDFKILKGQKKKEVKEESKKIKKCEHCDKELSKCTCDDSHLDESKPSAGLSKEKKSEVVKKAKAGSDIGKKGKGFEKIANKAAKKYGSKEKGKKVAAAAMWKNVQREDVETKKWVENITENQFFHSLTSKNEIMNLIKTKLNESETTIVNEEYLDINDIKEVINGTFRKK